MSFIYYVLILMLSYTGPVYAGLQVEKEYEIVEEDFVEDVPRYAQTEIEVGELPSGKLKVFTDQTHSTTIVVDKQDCSIMRKKDDTLALGFKFGGLMWGFGPEIKIGHSSGVAWKHDVQRMVAEYQELCTQFNTGRLSQQEYQAEKQQIVQRGYNYARELEKRFKQKKDDMFKEMDAGKYISLQNSRFFSGCCYYHNKPERNLVVEAPQPKVVPVHGRQYAAGYEWLASAEAESKLAEHQWKVKQCRNTGWCNGRMVRPWQRPNRLHNRVGRSYRPHIQNNRYQHNKDVHWDVYGNSHGDVQLRIEKEW